jgi:hypothetical protein
LNVDKYKMYYLFKGITMAVVKIKDETLDRLRDYLSKKYKGKMYGEISRHVEMAVDEWLKRQEKTEE